MQQSVAGQLLTFYNQNKVLVIGGICIMAFLMAAILVVMSIPPSTGPQAQNTVPAVNKTVTPTIVSMRNQTSPTRSVTPTSAPTTAATQAGILNTFSSISSLIDSSKLGIFVLASYTPGAKQIIQAKPAVIKVMDPQLHTDIMQSVKDYRIARTTGTVVLRVYDDTKKYTVTDDPVNSAKDYFSSVIKPALDKLGTERRLFTYVEAPNENDQTPDWSSKENAAWLGNFWGTLIELNDSSGMKTCIASIPVGNPSGEKGEIKEKFVAFIPALRKAVQYKSSFCYHAYSTQFSTDESVEIYYSLRYRMIHDIISEVDSSFATIPFVLSEAGVDMEGDTKDPSYQKRKTPEEFEKWLSWFDVQLKNDLYVQGATLFQIGETKDWKPYDLEPIAAWLTAHIQGK